VHGEKAVVRVLDTDPSLFNLDALGFREPVVDALRGFLARPQGTLLLTGPSSSGKTTTIYALLTELIERGGRARHIITLEDPVEYKLPGIAQSEVRPALEFDYQTALRAALRQDPEVIVVGEIRDAETARIAIQAGLTGHLVISTIHSGTAAGVFTRLLDMGVEPYLVASSLSAVLAQRLVRLTCPACATATPPDPALARAFGLDPAGAEHRRGAGCPECGGIGYHGRTAIGELLAVDETIASHVLDRARTAVLEHDAREAGMTSLHADGLARVRAGRMPLEELARVLPPPEEGGAS
jgi:type II secretory ATPase GspE/PulE/Tfp pilus assembly ATPase PilB-like protein